MTLSRVNLILFEPGETERPLPRSDRRARHIVEVLRREVGDTFDVGLINGPRGKATLLADDGTALALSVAWETNLPAPELITLIVGLPRPQTARDILRDATTLGIAALYFVRTEKGDANYAQSSLWSSDEWRRHVITGAEQAFATRLPEITHGQTLAAALATLPTTITRLALDNYESLTPLSLCDVTRDKPVALAIGGERGWSEAERAALRTNGFVLAHLGPRVLRTETACTVALAIVRAQLGLMSALR